MGIFDQEAKKMAQEASRRASGEEQRKAELRQAARRVSDDLVRYIAVAPANEDVEVGLDEAKIILRGKSSGRKLEITCDGHHSFRVGGDSGTAGAVTQEGMARRVITWLRELPPTT
jgi:hypothetical protein